MPYVNRELLRLSIDALSAQRYSPLLTVSLPCMLAHRIPTCATAEAATDAGFRFGSTEERAWLNQYFRVQGGPVGKPYFMPATREWVEPQYPNRSTQRQRTAYQDSVFFHPTRELWALRPDAAAKTQKRLVKEKPSVPLVALMAWMWRDREIDSIDEALVAFIAEVGFDRDGFLGVVFSPDLPPEFATAGLGDELLTTEDIAELTGAALPPPVAPVLSEAVAAIEKLLARKGFRAPAGLVERILGGWYVGDMVVLVGSTGSGKTSLARHLEEALTDLLGDRFFAAFLEITPDYDLAQFLGYENLAGEYTAGQFAVEVLFRGEATDPRLVVLDEWNLAQIDSYLAPVLSAIEAGKPLHLPGRFNLDVLNEEARDEIIRAQPDVTEGRWRLPQDTFFIATCNSWIEEPETRLPVSGPVKRRCRIIPMPNVLLQVLEEQGRAGMIEFCDLLLRQARDAVAVREEEAHSSILDRHRAERLGAVVSATDLPEDALDSLLKISQILLSNAHTKVGFTPGILRDLLLSCVYAPAGSAADALGQEISDKVLHQLQGDPRILEVIHGATRDFANAAEIEDLIRRMGGLSNERRIRPLV